MPNSEGMPTAPSLDPDMVVFTNYMRMIKKQKLTVEEANRELDSLGIRPNFRFWGVGSKVDPKSGRINIVYFNWINGGWNNAQKEIQEEIRKDIAGN